MTRKKLILIGLFALTWFTLYRVAPYLVPENVDAPPEIAVVPLETGERQPVDCCDAAVLLTEADMDAFAAHVAAIWRGESPPADSSIARLNTPAQAVYLALRSEGRRPAEVWATEGTTGEALAAAVRAAQQRLPRENPPAIDTLEIALAHSFQEFFPQQSGSMRSLLSNIHRGTRGLEIVFHDIVERYSPTYVLATNRDNKRLIDLFCERHKISRAVFDREARLFAFEAEQALVHLETPSRATLMERGNVFVPLEAVTHASVMRTANLAGQWLVNNVHENGRMTYKYWPSAATESTGNNMIRQWMATVALIRFGHAHDRKDILALAKRNIEHNLEQFYDEENGHGMVFCQGTVKLGAVALAALALFEHPERALWINQEMALRKTIDSLWNEDGSLVSFYKPAGDMRFQNFYPGEALLYWAFVYAQERNPELLRRFMASFRYYRDWHLDPGNRNPAFVPWHTQAYYGVWRITQDPELADFIFEMNDWLLGVQQWSERPQYRDTLGRFYDPNRPFGPPHSSSTGVYVEGLIDAFALARALNDPARMTAYRTSINRALRSVMQLQFVDEVDMFYVSPSMERYVRGGIRTTVYNNEIRCDNVQHNLMGILKVLDTFEERDYAGQPPGSTESSR